MCCLTQSVKITSDIDSVRSEIRDNSIRVIDVRREGDYKQDHIPNSVNLPLATLLSDDSPENVLKLVNSLGIDDEIPVVVYDDTFGALASELLGLWNGLVIQMLHCLKLLMVIGNHWDWKMIQKFLIFQKKIIL